VVYHYYQAINLQEYPWIFCNRGVQLFRHPCLQTSIQLNNFGPLKATDSEETKYSWRTRTSGCTTSRMASYSTGDNRTLLRSMNLRKRCWWRTLSFLKIPKVTLWIDIIEWLCFRFLFWFFPLLSLHYCDEKVWLWILGFSP
jgi:hypothetical protein